MNPWAPRNISRTQPKLSQKGEPIMHPNASNEPSRQDHSPATQVAHDKTAKPAHYYPLFIQFYTQAAESGFLAAVSDREWRTLCVLAVHMNAEGQCFPSRQTLARELGVSLSTVSERIQSLLGLQWNGHPVLTVERLRNANGTLGRQVYHLSPSVPLKFGKIPQRDQNKENLPIRASAAVEDTSSPTSVPATETDKAMLAHTHEDENQRGQERPLLTRNRIEQNPNTNNRSTTSTNSVVVEPTEKVRPSASEPASLREILATLPLGSREEPPQTMTPSPAHDQQGREPCSPPEGIDPGADLSIPETVARLSAFGISTTVATQLAADHAQVLRVLRWMEYLPESQDQGRPENVAGWVRCAIEQHWVDSPPWVRSAEKKMQERERLAASLSQAKRERHEADNHRRQVEHEVEQLIGWWQNLSRQHQEDLWVRTVPTLAAQGQPDILVQMARRSQGDDLKHPGLFWIRAALQVDRQTP